MAALLPESFRLVFHDSPLGVAVVSGLSDEMGNGLLLYANPTLLTLLHRWQPGRIDTLHALIELCTHDGERLLPLSEHTSQQHSMVAHVTLDATDVHWVEIRVRATTIGDENAHIFWINDVTAIKESEIIAKREARLADEAAVAKSNFLATMSHEIRTPLQSIFGMLELMNEENPTEKQVEMISAAKNSANSLLGVLDDILDLAKAEAGKVELDSFEVPLRTLVYGLVEALESKRRENNLYLKVDVEENVPFVVMGDPKRLRQILTNLVGNALKFTETGGITIKLSLGAREIKTPDGGIGLRFEVIDTGIGMTPAVAATLFQPFHQADNTTTRRFGGTGLGLSIAQRLVDLMGGRMGVISDIDKGSTFWFEIPTSVAAENRDIKLPDLTGLTVLSIEDHPRGAVEIKNSLQSMHAIVTSVNTCAEGMDLAAKRPFDVAVVDHGLPDGWGAALLKQLNKIRPFMGLILYTVHNDYDVQQICKFVGAQYLAKPASRLGLGDAVKAAAKQLHRLPKDGPKKLLICEDNISVRDIFARQLAIIGVEADFAADGQEAWEVLQENRHGIVITDLHMPRMDGYGLARAMRTREKDGAPHVPLIAMTADVQLVHEQSYLQHGFDECLLKPVSMGQIKRLLIRWGLLEEKTDTTMTGDEVEERLPSPQSSASDATLPDVSVIDARMAEQQFGAFDDDAKVMIRLFAQMTEPQITEMQAAFDAQDWAKLKNLAHSLKGAARSACCPQLGDAAATVQNHSIGGGVSKDVMARLTSAFHNVKAEMAKWPSGQV